MFSGTQQTVVHILCLKNQGQEDFSLFYSIIIKKLFHDTRRA